MPIVYEVGGVVASIPSRRQTGSPARLPIQSWSAPSSAIFAPCGPRGREPRADRLPVERIVAQQRGAVLLANAAIDAAVSPQ